MRDYKQVSETDRWHDPGDLNLKYPILGLGKRFTAYCKPPRRNPT
jgi:hypothetical protein